MCVVSFNRPPHHGHRSGGRTRGRAVAAMLMPASGLAALAVRHLELLVHSVPPTKTQCEQLLLALPEGFGWTTGSRGRHAFHGGCSGMLSEAADSVESNWRLQVCCYAHRGQRTVAGVLPATMAMRWQAVGDALEPVRHL